MRKEELLIDCTITAIKERLKTTLANIVFQDNVMIWDDEEKLEHCIAALEILEKEQKIPQHLPLERTPKQIVEDNEAEYQRMKELYKGVNQNNYKAFLKKYSKS